MLFIFIHQNSNFSGNLKKFKQQTVILDVRITSTITGLVEK